MANICTNFVRVSGDAQDIKKFVGLVGKEFDFNKIIPIEDDSMAREKWGCSSIAFDAEFGSEIDEEANWEFWTKWNPSTEIYKALMEKFPDVVIYWRYEEPGNSLYGFLQNEDL